MKRVEINWGAPNFRTDLSRYWAEVRNIVRHVEEVRLFTKLFFPIVDTCLSCEDIAQQICTMVPRWRLFGDFLGPAFPARRVQHISDLHSKFALRPHDVWKYGREPICDG